MRVDDAVAHLVDAELAGFALRSAGVECRTVQPSYVRHKPDESTVVAYRLQTAEPDDSWGYVRWFADPDRAAAFRAKALARRPRESVVGAGVVGVDANTVFLSFPNDSRLGRLRWYTQAHKLKRSLVELSPGPAGPLGRISARRTSLEVLRYKPERRVVVKANLVTAGDRSRCVVVRYTTQRRASWLAAVANDLRRQGVRTPRPIVQMEGGRLSVDEFMDGSQLRDVVAQDEDHGGQLAEALGRFHQAETADVGHRSVDSELMRARGGLAGLAAWGPDLVGVAAATAEDLVRYRPDVVSPEVLLHGDLHAKNVLVDRESIVFVDLERMAIGPPEVDLGYFIAHALGSTIRLSDIWPSAESQAERLLENYQRSWPLAAPSSLSWFTAVGLVDQALLVARHLEPGWPETSRRLLDTARSRLRADGDHRQRRGQPSDQPLKAAPAFLDEWHLAYPRSRGDWTVSGPQGWGLLDPAAMSTVVADPGQDRALPALGPALGPGRLVSYRVGRRAVVETDEGYVKVVPAARVDRLVAIHQFLTGIGRLAVPPVLGFDLRGAVTLGRLPGRSLHELLRSSVEVDLRRALGATGQGLPDLHRAVAPTFLQQHQPSDIATWVETVARVEPDAAPSLRQTAQRLPEVASGGDAVVHGDLHDKNLLLSGLDVGLLDLDGVSLGRAEDDLANLGVHLRLRALQAGRLDWVGEAWARCLYDGYRERQPLDEERLRAVEMHTWFRLACIYRFRRSGRHLVGELLRRAVRGPGR